MKLGSCEALTSDLMQPSSAAWAQAEAQTIALSPIPLTAQPNRYIRNKWKDRSYGTVDAVTMSALTSGDALFVRLEWPDADEPNGEFADAAAVVTGSGPAETLGSDDAANSLWYWAGDRDKAVMFESSGPGVFRRCEAEGIDAVASLEGGRWSVVLAGPIESVVEDRIGVAVWNGSNEERAGLTAVSGWVSLERE